MFDYDSNSKYAGDEYGALVFDPGSGSLRVGYGQEEAPLLTIPPHVGHVDEEPQDIPPNIVSYLTFLDTFGELTPEMEEEMEDYFNANPLAPQRKLFIDVNRLYCQRLDMKVSSYMKDGMIEDWDLFEKVIEYAYEKCIRCQPESHPLVMTEASWNEESKREMLTELMFEKFQVPFFYLAKNAALAALANGHRTGVVVDSGASHTSAVPVVDGYVLTRGIVRSPMGGDFLTKQCIEHLKFRNQFEQLPLYVASDEAYGAYESEDSKLNMWKYLKKKSCNVTQSWQDYRAHKFVEDMKQTIMAVNQSSVRENVLSEEFNTLTETPHGYYIKFGMEKYLIPEALFDPRILPSCSSAEPTTVGIHQLVIDSIRKCDVDLWTTFYKNIIIVGGNSQLEGFEMRLINELTSCKSHIFKVKLATRKCLEPQNAAWVGASIFASSGAALKLWISSQEYMEEGKSIIERRCP